MILFILTVNLSGLLIKRRSNIKINKNVLLYFVFISNVYFYLFHNI